MDGLKQIYDQKEARLKADAQHRELVDGYLNVSNSVIDSVTTLIKYLQGSTGKVQVVNQLRSIGTPDAFKVVQAVDDLHNTLKTHENTDLSGVTQVMQDVLAEVKNIPKEHAEQKEGKDYSKQLTDLSTAVKAIETAVKAQKLKVDAPVVNVAKPDLEPLKASMQAIVAAVNAIDIPKPESPYTKKGKPAKVELEDGAVPTSQTNILIKEKFDEYKMVYDDFVESSDTPVAIKYYYKKKKVATITYTYDDLGRLKGAKKS